MLALAAFATLAAPAFAQQMPHQGTPMPHQDMPHQGTMPHQGMDMQRPGRDRLMNDPRNPYGPAEIRMHDRMMQAMGTDDAETWTRKMIEHHRGAIEMSQIALREARDRETRMMAQKTIAMQRQDIAKLQDWLRRRGKRAQ
jgi:uncharacterized protein (DUF305 family)